jgi:hypothetical protein
VQVHTWMLEQPALNDRALVGAGVVEHKMQFELRGRSTLEGLQEVTKLHAAVAPVDFGDDRAGLDVQGVEEVGRAVTDVVVGMTFELAWSHGNCWCGVAVGLDERLLVHAEHQSALGWIQVQPHDAHAPCRQSTDPWKA